MAKKIVRIINFATAEPLVAATLERTTEQAKRNRLLELLQDAEGEEKSRILAQLVVLDEELESEKSARNKIPGMG